MTCANSVDPVQTLRFAASDQGLHCLLTGISSQNTAKVKIFTRTPITRNGFIQTIRMDQSKKGLDSLTLCTSTSYHSLQSQAICYMDSGTSKIDLNSSNITSHMFSASI